MRVGIFGGSFDPIHYGHLILAEQAREQGQLDQVWFLPAPRPPHKIDTPMTPFDQRVEMIRLAIAGNDAFRVELLEQEREDLSYTVVTLEELHRRHTGVEFFLLIGSDTLVEFHLWYQPLRILEMAGLLVMARPGSLMPSAEQLREQLGMPPDQELRVQQVTAPLVEISSRDLRRRASQGRSLRYFLPRAVEIYILEKALYPPRAPAAD